jgi:hypothetical protein
MGDAGGPALGLLATSLWSLATPLPDPAKSSQVNNHLQAARRRNLGLDHLRPCIRLADGNSAPRLPPAASSSPVTHDHIWLRPKTMIIARKRQIAPVLATIMNNVPFRNRSRRRSAHPRSPAANRHQAPPRRNGQLSATQTCHARARGPCTWSNARTNRLGELRPRELA